MKPGKKELIWAFALVVGLIMLWLAFDSEAHHQPDIIIDNSVTNNYYADENGSTSITSGLSDNEIAELLTTGVAAGSHQFDFSTTDWQGSITGAWYDDQDAVSFGLARRWDKFGRVLLHGNYTQNGGEDLWVVGGTFRF